MRQYLFFYYLPFAVTFASRAFQDAFFLKNNSQGLDGTFRLSYLCGYFFLGCTGLHLHYAKNSNLLQSAILALWRKIKCRICTLNRLVCTLNGVSLSVLFPFDMQFSVPERMLLSQMDKENIINLVNYLNY